VARGVTDWQPYKPVWWLMRELDHPASRGAAIRELSSRQAGMLLTQPQVDAAADKLLALQVDPRQTWVPAAGDFLEGARARRMLDDDRWHRYGRQAVQLSLDVRQWVRRGDVIPFQVRDTGARRAGSRAQIAVRGYAEVVVRDESFGVRELRGAAERLPAPATLLFGELPPQEYEARLADGPAPVRVRVDVQWVRSLHPVGRMPPTRIELSGEMKLFPPHESTVLVRYDESLDAEMRKAVRVQSISRGFMPGSNANVVVECKAPPVGVASGVFVFVQGRWSPCGAVACPPKETRRFQLDFAGFGLAKDRAVQVMFVPTPAAAAAGTDTFEMWNGVIEQMISVP
jgi:hypothetical protein